MPDPSSPPSALDLPTLRRIAAVRYVMPLREGGSVPALVEAEDGRLYVMKLRGAGQGPRALVAELLAGQTGRALGLHVPELVLLDLDAALARSEPHPEIQDLLRASAGLNLGLAHLDGAVTFDPAAQVPPSSGTASKIVALDSYTTNVDRTARNPNLLWSHGHLAPIDHGAAFYWQHDWDGSVSQARPDRGFPLVRDHVLLPWAEDLVWAGRALVASTTDDLVAALVDQLPDDWLAALPAAPTAEAQRAAYAGWLCLRRAAVPALMEEAARARTSRV